MQDLQDTGNATQNQQYTTAGFDPTKININSNEKSKTHEDISPPFLTTVLYILAVLGFLGGIILCVTSWPNESYVRTLKSMAYFPSITWLTAGIVEAVLFSAIGLGLKYLKIICLNTKPI